MPSGLPVNDKNGHILFLAIVQGKMSGSTGIERNLELSGERLKLIQLLRVTGHSPNPSRGGSLVGVEGAKNTVPFMPSQI